MQMPARHAIETARIDRCVRRARSAPRGDVPGLSLWLALLAVVSSFAVSNLIVQRSSTAVATLAASILETSSPSIERMASARRSVLQVEVLLFEMMEQPSKRAEHEASLDSALDEAKRAKNDYMALPVWDDERKSQVALEASWGAFERAVVAARALVQAGDHRAALDTFFSKVEPAQRQFVEHAGTIIELNAAHGRDLAQTIAVTRRRTTVLAGVANAVCALFTLLVGYLLHRQAVARRTFEHVHLEQIESRATELEQFAGRVAHDIRNPLAAARNAAELASRRTEDPTVRDLHQRVMRSLSRADAITTALLDFARSGAMPDPGARTVPREVVNGVTAELEADARRAGIQLTTESIPPVAVACARGVYMSLLGNLLRNAIKYMRDVEERKITVRVMVDGRSVRTEVADTGPGIAASTQSSLFQIYVRGPTGGAEGLGLGLATVKRLVEGHGGEVGVRSEPGAGSTFWFTLPRAGDEEVELTHPSYA
jgi:signal transduction histidine kinase